MKPIQNICIFGAGAMGCLIGGLMQRAGHSVTYIARGQKLQDLQQHGLTLTTEGDRWSAPVKAVEAAQAGKQDLIIVCTKAHQLPSAVADLRLLMDDNTIIVPAVNGLPWWYFQNYQGDFADRTLEGLDAGGVITAAIPAAQIIGCVNYLAGHVSAPGTIQYVPELKRRIVLGELGNVTTPRLEAVGKIFTDAGLEAVLTNDIRQSVWHKLWGNIAFNPIGALTHGTIDQLAEGYEDIDLISAVMNETRFIADKLGVAMNQTTRSRVTAAARMRGHKTSMQLDIEAGRPTEIEAIVGAARDIAKWMEVDTPHLNVIYSLMKLKERFYAASGEGHA